jgi:hypothetical protein
MSTNKQRDCIVVENRIESNGWHLIHLAGNRLEQLETIAEDWIPEFVRPEAELNHWKEKTGDMHLVVKWPVWDFMRTPAGHGYVVTVMPGQKKAEAARNAAWKFYGLKGHYPKRCLIMPRKKFPEQIELLTFETGTEILKVEPAGWLAWPDVIVVCD